ncbi:NHL repeat-containing protein [Aetokthonos hydrillicola Thurmond2011]|jgi:DNA-binding beta-propeller fold protein YncE|uniref:NHL repeat-containing protein n=1 Tax=Aetokthonos hydrillicola Thurmond2011 TaxID=2712845 RepID=A0AAP5M8E8_9CYAN|nr:NHL repeat-containing protein [Aetokthonos hydrillicola]MBO3459401.1 hypothetical protein [Aetokthonos hydrillicola CCALA 1050]MBW4586547.1 NHL repeat-containing protein [Aetokthonos hydrillicola CCALA 1050]MDR9893508.1 NHL repeat-containing protein [Aetokthonos hydrillicola Thurmond2011]
MSQISNFFKILSLTVLVLVVGFTTLKAQAALLVSSRFSNSIKIYDEQGNFIRDFVPPGSGGLNDADGLAIGPDGNLYVASYLGGSILRYNGKNGKFIDTFVPAGSGVPGTPGLQRPTALTFGPNGNLYVSNYLSESPNEPEVSVSPNDNVLEFDGKTGAFIQAFLPPIDQSPSEGPLALTFGPDGYLYVTASKLNSVLRYNPTNGAFIDSFIPSGSAGLANPTGLAFGKNGNLYVSNFGGNNILEFDGQTGTFVKAFTTTNTEEMSGPSSVVFGPDNNLYVTGLITKNVVRYDGTTGESLGEFVPAGKGGLDGTNLGLVFDQKSCSVKGGRK